MTLADRRGKTVREVREETSTLEFAEWVALNNIEPIGEYRNDVRFGVAFAQLANAIIGLVTGKPGKAKAEHFMPQFEKPAPKPNALLDQLKLLAAATGGTVTTYETGK